MKNYNEMAESVLKHRNQYILEQRRRMKKTAATISCFCICLVVSLGVWKSDFFKREVVGESFEQAVKETLSSDIGSVIHEAAKGSDVPVQNEAGDTGALKPIEEIWGGSYLNEQGKWVIWLTEDTPENRAEALQKNPALSESSTVFQKADYSLDYLTQLMADISKAMGDKTLSFVTTAALREDRNRIEVTMTDTSEAAKAKVLAIDSLGGAIEIKFSTYSGAAVEEMMKEPYINY